MCCDSLSCKRTNHLAAAPHRWDFFFLGRGENLVFVGNRFFQHGTQNINCTGTFTSHSPMASWFLSWISQSSWTSAQWWMVSITGLVSRAPGGPQLTTGLSSVWASSTGGLNETDNSYFQPQGGQNELTSVFGCLFYFLLFSPPQSKASWHSNDGN